MNGLRTPLARLALGLAVGLAAAGCGGGPGPPERVFLVTIDTLRADHLGLYGYPRGISPFLDSLGGAGLTFEKAYSSCSHTAPSHASLFTALHPAQHRLLRNGEELHDSLLTLAAVFHDRGYRTAGFTTTSFLAGLDPGFDDFHYETRFFPAKTILGQAEEWIRAQPPKARLFVWIHLFDVHQWHKEEHLDQEAQRELRSRGGPRGQELLDFLGREQGTELGAGAAKVLRAVNRYDGQILSVDRELGRFFERLKGDGLARRSLWVVTSDHGEGLGNHDYLGHGKTVYNEQIHVPLVFYFTDRRFEPRRVDGLVQLVDVAPTLAELVGGSFDGQSIPPAGRSLVPLLRHPGASSGARAVFAQRRPADEMRLAQGWAPGDIYALRTERYKVIAHSEGKDEIYDLTADRFERHNLIDEPSPEETRLLESLKRQYSAMTAEGEELGSGTINPKYVEELKALGYL